MNEVVSSHYGSWKSPLTIEKLLQESIQLNGLNIVDGEVYFSELRPNEGGRNVLCKLKDGAKTDLLPPEYNNRTRVHEYGGSALLISNKICYFSNFTDQKIYKMEMGIQPKALTSSKPYRFADFSIDSDGSNLYAVMEDHSESDINATNSIVKINLKTGEIVQLALGFDFYSSPRLNCDNTKIVYICWNHPNMPWDENELWVADITKEGRLENNRKIAGGNKTSIFQPEWAKDGSLYFVDDKSGWWNIYQYRNKKIKCICEKNLEFGRPQWRFGDSTFKLIDNSTIICTYRDKEKWNLARLDVNTSDLLDIHTPFTSFHALNIYKNSLYFIGASPRELASIVKLDLSSQKVSTLYAPTKLPFSDKYISEPELIEFPTENNKTAFAFFYPPHNPDINKPVNELPPLIVMSHGGPTGCSEHILSIKNSAPTQYWTTRGFAVIDVNYGGSTGYGRKYRERLNKTWGITDVKDCENAAKYLIKQQRVDKNRIAIRGGSAGGYTTLCALVFTDTFAAGASFFGVSNLESLARETHKFESRYLDSMIGPYPELKDVYYERSPINHTEKLSCPIIFFQGLEDKVVPPNQAEDMYKILLKKQLPTAYIAYEGEQHGFRKAENIKHSLESELFFYSKVFNISPADKLPEIEINNLKI